MTPPKREPQTINELRALGDPGKCSGCGLPVVWVETKTRKRMPLDPRPAKDGNVAFEVVAGRPVACVLARGQVLPHGRSRWVPHFASCRHPVRNSKRVRSAPPTVSMIRCRRPGCEWTTVGPVADSRAQADEHQKDHSNDAGPWTARCHEFPGCDWTWKGDDLDAGRIEKMQHQQAVHDVTQPIWPTLWPTSIDPQEEP